MNRFFQIIDRLIVFSFYGLIYFLPISIALCEVFSTIPIFLFLLKRFFLFCQQMAEDRENKEQCPGCFLKRGLQIFLTAFRPSEAVLRRPIFIFILVSGLSIFWSQYPQLSIKGFFFKVLQWTFVYFVFVEYMKAPKRLKIFGSIFLLSLFLVSLNGLIQQGTGVGFIFGQKLLGGRVLSSFRHPNDFGTYLLVGGLFLYGLLFSRQYLKAFWIIIAGLFTIVVICLGLTYSRGAWISFFVGLLLFGIIHRRALWMSILIIILFYFSFQPRMAIIRKVSLTSDDVIVVSEKIKEIESSQLEERPQLDSKNKEKLLEKIKREPFSITKVLTNLKHFGASGRLTYWHRAIRVIQDHPFVGTGINTYSQVSQKYDEGAGGYPHNCYLQMIAEIGILGVLSFLWIIWSLLVYTFRSFFCYNNSSYRFIALGLLCGLIGFFINGSVDTNFYSVKLSIYMWLMMAFVVALCNILPVEYQDVRK